MIKTIKTQINDQWQLLNVNQQYKKPAFEAYEMKNSFISLDQAFEYVGDNSKYQQRITLILSIQFLFYSFFVMGMTYLFVMPKFCTTTFCTEKEICDDSLYELLGFDNITKEYHLFCGQQGKQSYIAAMFFVGQMFGGFTFPIFANIWGRRNLLLFGSSLGGIAILISGISTSIFQLYVLFWIAGFGLMGYETVVYVYINEISALRFRSIASSLLVVIWSSSMLVYPFIVDTVRNWRELIMYGVSLPFLVSVVISYFYFVESPRWLASKQQYEACRQVFKTISIFNRRRPFEYNFVEELDKFNSNFVSLKSSMNVERYTKLKDTQRHYNYWSLLSHSKVMRITLILIWMWFLRYSTYYGLQFSASKFGISVTEGLRILATVELLTGMSSLYFKLKYQRVSSLQICLLAMTLSALLSNVNIPKECNDVQNLCWQQVLHLISAIMIKAAITIYNSMLNTYTGEVYTTSLRSYGYGFCMTLGQIGSTFAPVYVQHIQQYSAQASPVTIVTGLALLGAVFTCFLPETFQKEMYENIEDQLIADELATELVSLNHNNQTNINT